MTPEDLLIRENTAQDGQPVAASGEETAAVEIGLNAAIVSMICGEPQILTVSTGGATNGDSPPALPFGLFTPLKHRTLEIGLRDWVKDQTGVDLGYVEQLYTFGDRGRHARPGDEGMHVVSIGYLALTRNEEAPAGGGAHWNAWYRHLPWEDWRNGKPQILTQEIEPRLEEWAHRRESAGTPRRPLARRDRFRMCFGQSVPWDDEKVLDRYELLYEAGLIAEAARDGREAARAWSDLPQLGRPMMFDHRRILATAMSRLRGKLKYRPVIFELMSETFTLLDLQRVVEAILGSYLHKQNFRRLVENAGLVELTGQQASRTGGRPARLYRFRKSVLLERPAPGFRVRVQNIARTNSTA
ncbi:NrtR DNA-binding winged helix domain-containing protein [Rhodomicrobium lacus]|uniref:NUDIX hydrolase n=1 Tax=Rhodomicrobium TaxID=1068 RepID=UPI000F8E1ECB